MTTDNPEDFEVEHFEDEHLGDVPVDSGTLLIVDPCHLPPEVLEAIARPNRHGVTLATVVATPLGDGMYGVYSTPEGLVVGDPYGPGGRWHEDAETVVAALAG